MIHLLSFVPLAESALLVRVGNSETIEPAVVERIWALTTALDETSLPGVVDVVPSYTTILIAFDPRATDPASIEDWVRRLAMRPSTGTAAMPRETTIPIAYGGEHGPDLADVARLSGLTPEEVIACHAGASYRVACMGFAPGWAYLMGLPPRLTIPRLTNPRVRVPPGSLGIGGAQTGIYPLSTPGGWRLIGRTPLKMFDPARAEPFFLRAGDRVRFRPIDAAEYAAIERQVTAGVSALVGAGDD